MPAKTNLPDVLETYAQISPELYAGKLNGKVALITGCSVGLGRAIAKAFAAAGASVAVLARREPELLTLVDEITSAKGKAIAIVADVAVPGEAQRIVQQVEKQLGAVDILVNNAGIARISALIDEPEDIDIWWRTFEVNVRGPVALIRAVLPGMIARGYGKLISTTSSVATLPLLSMSAYTSSKAAFSKFHESLQYELEGTGVSAFALCPSTVSTDLGKSEFAMNKASMEHPATKKFFAGMTGHAMHTPELTADTMVALAADEKYTVLAGYHLKANEELPLVLKEAQKEGKGQLGENRLYLVNIASL